MLVTLQELFNNFERLGFNQDQVEEALFDFFNDGGVLY